MKWKNLKSNLCPQCGKDLIGSLVGHIFECECGFKITMFRFKEIVGQMVEEELDRYEQQTDREDW